MGYTIKDLDRGAVGKRQTISVRVTFEDENAAVSFPSLPVGTVLHDCRRNVTTLFNDSGTDTLKVGTAANDDLLCDTGDTTLTGTGLNTDVVSGQFPQVLAAATAFQVLYEGQNNDATTGVVDVELDITLMPNV